MAAATAWRGRRRAALHTGAMGRVPPAGRGQRFFELDACVSDVVKTPLGILRQASLEAAAECRPAPFRAARSNPARARGRRRSCPTAWRGRTPAGPPASRRARSRTTRCRCAHPSRARAPAPATCRPWCRRPRPSSSATRACSRGPVARPLAVLGDAEVEDLHQPVRAHHDVLGLDVAVDDACAVRGR